MTMLTHARGRFERATYSSEDRTCARATSAAAQLAMIKRVCMAAVTILAAGAVLAAVMALKVAIYLPGFIHH